MFTANNIRPDPEKNFPPVKFVRTLLPMLIRHPAPPPTCPHTTPKQPPHPQQYHAEFGQFRPFLIAYIILSSALVVACGEDQKTNHARLRSEAADVLGTPAQTGAASSAPPADASTWTVILAAFPRQSMPGVDVDPQLAQARARAALLQAQGAGLDAVLRERGNATVVAFGSFESSTSADAQAALARARAAQVNGRNLYADAFLAPPTGASGSIPEFDLRNAKRLHTRAEFTLQVAVYGRADNGEPSAADLATFRRAAEQAVIELRNAGELAFYFHGPNRSVVTVGLFNASDAGVVAGKPESSQMRELRRKHPQNLLNGQAIRERIPGRLGDDPSAFRIQASQVVAVPG